MNKVEIKTSIKEWGAAALDTFKQKPIRSLLKIAAVVAALALSVLIAVYLGPLVSIPIIIIVTAINLINPTLLSLLFFQDIKASLFAQFKKNHAIDKVANSDVVLVLEAKHDHNSTFQEDQRNIFYKVKKKYALAYEKVSGLGDIAKSIDRVIMRNNRIKAIWIRGHGNPISICLDKKSDLNIWNVALLKYHFRHLDPHGCIILDSCSTGGKNSREELNIAQKIALLAKGRKVIAPSRDTLPFSMKIGKENPLNVKMWTEFPASKHHFWKYPSIVINALKSMAFFMANGKGPFKNWAYDATQVYCYP